MNTAFLLYLHAGISCKQKKTCVENPLRNEGAEIAILGYIAIDKYEVSNRNF